MRIMIAGGGTGGHIYPGVAIYHALKNLVSDVEVLFVGAKSGVEARLFEELGLPNVLLSGRGVRGSSFAAKLTSPIVFLAGLVRGVREIAAFKPDIVIGTGGYASVALVGASVLCGTRRALQEQNSVPGLANRVLSRFAHLVLLSYEESRPFFGSGVRCEVVGNPLRIDTDISRDEAIRFFDLRSDLQTVLIYGGSRGAQAINTAAADAIGRILAKREVQFVILTGHDGYERVSNDLAGHSALVRVYPFLAEMQHAYAAADIAVSRAGASSVFELAAFGVPSVFVPYPYAADDHQRLNAKVLETRGAGVVIDNAALDGEKLEALILSLLDDDNRRQKMSDEMRNWFRKDADRLAAEKILDLVGESRLSLAQIEPDHLG